MIIMAKKSHLNDMESKNILHWQANFLHIELFSSLMGYVL